MILWIASYPKSGNTWVRSLISTYLYSNEGEFNFDLLHKIPKFIQEKYISPVAKLEELKKDSLKITEYWEAAQLRINLDNQIKFFKTHNACVAIKDHWFTNEKNTLGYIYIVRDPRAVACSNAKHSNISMEESVNNLINENQIGYNPKYKLVEVISSWKINYQSWKKKKKFDGIIIKYEDLIDNTEREFKKILTFLKKKTGDFNYENFYSFDINQEKINQSIDSCKFSNMKKMEDMFGFEEALKNKFFRKGTKEQLEK